MGKSHLHILWIGTASIFFMQDIHSYSITEKGKVVTHFDKMDQIVDKYSVAINNKADAAIAKEMELKGKLYFLKGDLTRSQVHGYGIAQAWLPKPEYFFIIGDLEFRGRIHQHTGSPRTTQAYKSCWDKYLFNADAQEIMTEGYDFGFHLVSRLNLSETRNSDIYKEARLQAVCIASLADAKLKDSDSECVPIEKVKNCLGKPLLFFYH